MDRLQPSLLIAGSFEPETMLMEGCQTSSAGGLIVAECTYARNSVATGFQITAQLRNFSEAGKLYVNHTTSHQTQASVEVEESGMYLVNIFAIRGERGLLDSTVEFREQLWVDVAPSISPTAPPTPRTTTATSSTASNTAATPTSPGRCCKNHSYCWQ